MNAVAVVRSRNEWFDLGVIFSLLFIGDERRIDGHDWYDMLFGCFPICME